MRGPQQIVEYINSNATAKASLPTSKVVVASIIGGIYIAMGGLLSVVIGYGFPEISSGNPALTKLLMGATFPVGLIMIVLAGGELFTGCCAYFIPNTLSGRERWSTPLKYCSIVWVANFVGALLFGYLLVYLPHISHYEPTLDGFMRIAEAKSSNTFMVTLLKGIGANYLVCLAVWLGAASKSAAGKIMGIWFPVMCFVAIGYEHSVANMFFLPVAMLEGFDLSIGELFVRNLIPSTIGNIIGGALCMGTVYWYLYDKK